MNRKHKIMKAIFFFNLILVSFFSCNSEQAIRKETQKQILSHKQFIKEIYFKGKINDKIYCNECNFNKYRIKIKTEEMKPDKIELGNLSFQPYYVITSKNEITLSISKEIFESVEIGLEVVKNPSSNNLSIKSKDYKLLSEEKFEWIPK